MKSGLLSACLLGIAVSLGLGGAQPVVRESRLAAPPSTVPVAAPAHTPARVDFQTEVRPILEARCQPCHFAGGKMYARLPFDRPETIRTLGEKMFTRIKDEREVALIRSFLAQQQ